MKHVSIRFLIGLGDPSDPSKLRPAQLARPASVRARMREALAREALAGAYDVGGLYSGEGYWKGTPEPCIMFETIQEDSDEVRERARSVARRLRETLEQDAIGLVFAPVAFELI